MSCAAGEDTRATAALYEFEAVTGHDEKKPRRSTARPKKPFESNATGNPSKLFPEMAKTMIKAIIA